MRLQAIIPTLIIFSVSSSALPHIYGAKGEGKEVPDNASLHAHTDSSELHNETYTPWGDLWQLYPSTKRNCYESGVHASFEVLLEAGYGFCQSSTEFIQSIATKGSEDTWYSEEFDASTSRNYTTGSILKDSNGQSMSVVFQLSFNLHQDNFKLLQSRQTLETCWELLKQVVLECRKSMKPYEIMDEYSLIKFWARGGVSTAFPRWSHFKPGRECIHFRVDPNGYDPKLDEGKDPEL